MSWWARAEALEAQGKLGDADAAIQQALSIDPSDPNALLVLALIQHDRGRPDEAYQSFKQAAAIARSQPEI